MVLPSKIVRIIAAETWCSKEVSDWDRNQLHLIFPQSLPKRLFQLLLLIHPQFLVDVMQSRRFEDFYSKILSIIGVYSVVITLEFHYLIYCFIIFHFNFIYRFWENRMYV